VNNHFQEIDSWVAELLSAFKNRLCSLRSAKKKHSFSTFYSHLSMPSSVAFPSPQDAQVAHVNFWTKSMIINASELPIPLEPLDTNTGIRALRCVSYISTNRPTLMTLMTPQKFCLSSSLCPISITDGFPHAKVPNWLQSCCFPPSLIPVPGDHVVVITVIISWETGRTTMTHTYFTIGKKVYTSFSYH
jgi:hypothetical protein